MSDHIARLEQSLADANDLLRRRGKDELGEAIVEDLLANAVGPQLKAATDHLCRNVLKRHAVDFDKQDSREVVHYTSLSAMVSMLEALANERMEDVARADPTSGFRLYDSAHLNDPDEGNYLFRDLDDRCTWLVGPASRPAYIGSFILSHNTERARDNLVFWRAYGEEGTGCSLAFKISKESRALRVRYGSECGRDKTIDDLTPLFATLTRFVETLPRDRDDRSVVESFLAGVVSTSLEAVRYLYKSSAYKYENECRIVRSASEIEPDAIRPDCRTPFGRPAYLRHYCVAECLQLADLLKSDTVITIGPRVPERESVKACFNALLGTGGPSPVIKCSKISYQAF